MGEQKRRIEQHGFKMRPLRPGEQISATPEIMKNATPKVCECGCRYFMPVVMVHTVSALVSPTGQALVLQQPALICMDCKAVLK